MEGNSRELAALIGAIPGDFGIYRVCGQAVRSVYSSAGLPSLCAMEPAEYEAIVTRSAAELVLPADRPSVAARLHGVLAQEAGEGELHFRVLHKTRGAVWLHVRARHIGAMEGDPLVLVLFFGLSYGMQEYAALLDRADAGVYVLDAQSRELLYANARMAELCGKADYMGRACYRWISGLDKPCPWCTVPAMKDGFAHREVCYAPPLDRWFRVECRAMTWFERPAVAVYMIDVTEQEKNRRSLELDKKSLETIVNNLPVGVGVCEIRDGKARALVINRGLRELTGADADAFERADGALLRCVHPDDRGALFAALSRCARPDAQVRQEYRFRRPDQASWHWFRMEARTIAQGESTAAFVCLSDVTARRQEEQNYARIFRQMAEADPETLCVFRLNLSRNRCTAEPDRVPSCLQAVRQDTAEAFLTALRACAADERDKARLAERFTRQALLEAFEAGQADAALEFRLQGAGAVQWVKLSVHMAPNPASGEAEALASLADSTERKKDEEVILHLTRRKFDYIGLLDLKTQTIEFRSRQPGVAGNAAQLPGRSEAYQQWRRYMVENRIPPEERDAYLAGTALPRIEAELAEQRDYSFAFRQKIGGVESRRQLQYSRMEGLDGKVLVIRTDITAAYRTEQEQLARLREALRAAEEADRAKTEFLSRISHDIRTPISIISSMTGFALEDLAQPEKAREDLARIRAANTFLLSLINDVLDISKIDSGKIELNPEPYTFAEHNANIRNMLEPMCAQKGLHCVMERRRSSGVIVADRVRLNQITLNVLSNAVKYTPAGGTVTYISDSEDLPDARIRFGFEVRDTGIGMSPEFQKRMFEPFTQEYDNPLRPKAVSGTGLGLSIVQKMVALMGGTLRVQSAPGKGTTVRCDIIFPDALRDPRWQPALKKQGAPAAALPPRPLTGTVLVAEDNPVNAEIAARILTGFGLRVAHAANGAEAVAALEASRPGGYAAVLMDIQMPVMDGYEATRRIRALPRPDAGLPIFAMTADAFTDAQQRGMEAGMTAYLTKPIDPARLRAILEKEIRPDV